MVTVISGEPDSETGSTVVVGAAVVASRIKVPGAIEIFGVVVSCPGVVGNSVAVPDVVVKAPIGACVWVVVAGEISGIIGVVVSDAVAS